MPTADDRDNGIIWGLLVTAAFLTGAYACGYAAFTQTLWWLVPAVGLALAAVLFAMGTVTLIFERRERGR